MLEGIVNPCTIKAIEAIEDCTMDEFIKKISKHLRLVPKKDIETEIETSKKDWRDDLPPIMFVADIKAFTRLGKNRVYELLNHSECPTRRNGTRLAVYRDEFLEFFFNNRNLFSGEDD